MQTSFFHKETYANQMLWEWTEQIEIIIHAYYKLLSMKVIFL